MQAGHHTGSSDPHLDEGMAFSNSHERVLWAGRRPSKVPLPLPSDRYKFHGAGTAWRQPGDWQRSEVRDGCSLLPCGHPHLSEAVPMPSCCVAMLNLVVLGDLGLGAANHHPQEPGRPCGLGSGADSASLAM